SIFWRLGVLAILSVSVTLGATRPAFATGPSGAAERRARLDRAEALVRTGHRADAELLLLKFADEYNDGTIGQADAEGPSLVGRAMHLLRHAKEANTAYMESERADKAR